MRSPRLAVIITCWNYEAYVGRAIRSVLSQGGTDYELIVVDDGSTDLSWEAIQREGATSFRISNRGQLAACLYGVDRTQAPFILFLDADDELAPGCLERLIAELDDDVAKLQFSLTRIDANGDVIDGAFPFVDFRSREDLAKLVLQTGAYATPPTSGNVFRRDVCELLREVDYEKATDGVILLAAPFIGDVVSLSDNLGRYRVHGRNDSGVGRPLDPTSLQRDIRRFVDRMNHLRRILSREGRGDELVDPENTYFFRERSFYFGIAKGNRPSLLSFVRLLRQLWRDNYPVKTKLTLSAFFLAAIVLPNRQARAVILYRLAVGKRSWSGMLRACR
jgi:glycosyltransferase involved in cell wall biosynthesis